MLDTAWNYLENSIVAFSLCITANSCNVWYLCHSHTDISVPFARYDSKILLLAHWRPWKYQTSSRFPYRRSRLVICSNQVSIRATQVRQGTCPLFEHFITHFLLLSFSHPLSSFNSHFSSSLQAHRNRGHTKTNSSIITLPIMPALSRIVSVPLRIGELAFAAVSLSPDIVFQLQLTSSRSSSASSLPTSKASTVALLNLDSSTF